MFFEHAWVGDMSKRCADGCSVMTAHCWKQSEHTSNVQKQTEEPTNELLAMHKKKGLGKIVLRLLANVIQSSYILYLLHTFLLFNLLEVTFLVGCQDLYAWNKTTCLWLHGCVWMCPFATFVKESCFQALHCEMLVATFSFAHILHL